MGFYEVQELECGSDNAEIDMARVPAASGGRPDIVVRSTGNCGVISPCLALILLLSSSNLTLGTTQRCVAARLRRNAADTPGRFSARYATGTRPQEHHPEYILSGSKSMESGQNLSEMKSVVWR